MIVSEDEFVECYKPLYDLAGRLLVDVGERLRSTAAWHLCRRVVDVSPSDHFVFVSTEEESNA